MDKVYYEAVDKMEKMGVDRDYMIGWMSGYLHNPKLEEQRVTEPYEAGYEAGQNKSTDDFEKWTKQ